MQRAAVVLATATLAATVLGLGGLTACTRSEIQESPERRSASGASGASAAPASATLPSPPPRRGIEEKLSHASGHSYRIFSSPKTQLAIRLNRPSPKDARVLLSVAGTYTSPDDKVLGIVMLDGNVASKGRMAWEGLLTIEDGTPSIKKASRSSFSAQELLKLASKKTSLLQGHLLVHSGQPERYKPSPPLHRRALAVFDRDNWAIVESVAPVELQSFARDLASLGADAALNLDMGGWSEGWFRDTSETPKPLGIPHPSTARQTNWLVILTNPASQ